MVLPFSLYATPLSIPVSRESAIAVVVKEKVAEGIVRDEDVGEAVAIVVGENHPHAFADMLADAGLLGDIGKGAVAVVVKQHVRLAGIVLRRAVGDDVAVFA